MNYFSVLTCGALAATLPSAFANFDEWKSEVNAGTLPAVARFLPVSGLSPVTINVGDLTGDRSFEFIVNSGAGGASQALLGNSAANGLQGLKFEQWSETGRYGMTDYGIIDYSGSPYDTGRDVHIVYVSNDINTKLYVDGELKFTFDVALRMTGDLGIAGALTATGTYGDPLDGTIKGFASYDTALSDQEILTHYQKFHASIPPTDIVLSRQVFASNTPAGGLVGLLSATDTDDLEHTFAITAETTSSTQPLLLASATGWRFFDGLSVPPPDWATPAFDASGWAVGQAPLGYANAGTEPWQLTQLTWGADTAAKPVTTWFRKSFTVTGAAQVSSLSGTLQVDDGCVIYLNGFEVFRQNMPLGVVSNSTLATAAISGTDESDYTPFTVPADMLSHLVEGENILAVEVHQNALNSSDITLDATLVAGVSTTVNGFDNALFTLAGNQLRLAQAASAIPAGPKSVRLSATDSDGNTIIKVLTVTPLDTPFTASPVAIALAPSTVAEALPAGAPVGIFTATDADTPEAHSFDLVPGEGDTGNASFVVSGHRLLTAAALDYELSPTVSIRVQATDSTGNTFTAPVTITLTDDVAEDQDGDGLTEADEDVNNNNIVDPGETSPLLADTDGDTFNDGLEIQYGTDPLDPASFPSVVEVRQIASHPTGDSWLTAASWEGGAPLQSFNVAVVQGLTFRSPPELNPIFPGAAVDLRAGSIFRMKHTGLAAIPKLILQGGTIQQGMTESIAVGGTGSIMEVKTTATLDAAASVLDLQAALSGRGKVRAIAVAGGQLTLSAAASGFSGDFIADGPPVSLASPDALHGATLVFVRKETLSTSGATALPGTILRISGTGALMMTNPVTVSAAILGSVVVPAGTFSATELAALGIPAAMTIDGGGTLTVTGDLAAKDTDGDGALDIAETLALTDPRDPADFLRVSSAAVTADGNGLTLVWTSVPGEVYTVQSSATLADAWTDIAPVTAAAATSSFIVPLPVAGGHGFYRVSLKP